MWEYGVKVWVFKQRFFFFKVVLIEDAKDEKTVKETAKGAIAAADSGPAVALQRRQDTGHCLLVCRSALFCHRLASHHQSPPKART